MSRCGLGQLDVFGLAVQVGQDRSFEAVLLNL